MFKTEKVNEANKQRIIDFLKSDVIRHVFAFYDIQHDPQHTTMYAAFENGNLKGYILIYTATDVPSIILECEEGVAEALIEYAPQNNFIIHTPPNLIPSVQRKFQNEKHYIENWMLVRRDQAHYYKSEFVRRLNTEDDALRLAELVSNRKDRPKRALKKYIEWITKMPVYGLFLKGRLVSYAGSFLQLPQIWMIGGVYTQPRHRNRGHATLAVSAITKEALRKAETAALFVRSDNYSAIKVYEKIGYQKIGEKLWVDIGTGLRP
jgi:ribosomal protein S18 acetylase RimI-like enzyme